MQIYFDNAATTKLHDEVKEEIIKHLDYFHNPDASYVQGICVKDKIEEARNKIAKAINANHDQIFFTSGGSEANNWVLNCHKNKKKIITSKIEHKSILNNKNLLLLDVNSNGTTNLDSINKYNLNDISLMSLMMVNNETGSIQDVGRMVEICKKNGIFSHTDAIQALGKMEIDVKMLDVDFMSLSAHKIHAPKGIGCLYVRDISTIQPLIVGGQQEMGLRGGTSNVLGILGFAKAIELIKIDNHVRKLSECLRNELNELGGIINGLNTIPHITSCYFKDIECNYLLHKLNQQGICISCGSACNSKVVSGSHVLKAMNLGVMRSMNSIRISLSRYNTQEEIDYFIKILKEQL